MMARAKRIYILIVKVNKLFSFFSSRCFLKEIENMFSVFLSSYRNTRESLGELEKAVETFLVLLNFHSCLYNSIETRYMFSIFLINIVIEQKETRWDANPWPSHLVTKLLLYILIVNSIIPSVAFPRERY